MWDTPSGFRSEDGEVPQATWWAITIDCRDTRRVAEFWSAVLNCSVIQPGPDRPGWLRLEPRGSEGPFITFQPVPELKDGKVRIHVDVLVADMAGAVDHVISLGGTDTGAREQLPRGRIAVMCDPEGNEFCLLAPPSPRP